MASVDDSIGSRADFFPVVVMAEVSETGAK